MSKYERSAGAKPFDVLREQIDADARRRERVDEHKAAMLADLRRELDLTQVVVAERLEVTQANVSQIERGEDVRLSTLRRYVAALGGVGWRCGPYSRTGLSTSTSGGGPTAATRTGAPGAPRSADVEVAGPPG